MDFARRAVDAAFRRLGVEGTFVPASGDPVSGILLMVRQADAGFSPAGVDLVGEATVIDVRASDVAAPAVGDSFQVDGVTYRINAEPRRGDAFRLIWTCQAPEKI